MKLKLNNLTVFKVSDKRGWILYRGQNGLEESSVVVEEGSIPFCSCLTYEYQNIDTVVKHLLSVYIDVSYETLKNDAIEFYYSLKKLNMVDIECDDELQQIPSDSMIKEGELTQEIDNSVDLRHIHIELTNRCNERCIHCYIPHQDKIKDMDNHTLDKILDEIDNSSSVMSVNISGGEPMLHPSFAEVIKRLQTKHIFVTVFTNLTLLNDEYLELFKNPLTTVQISLYSLKAETHDKITILKGSFDKTFTNIKKLLNNNANVWIACPLMDYNINDSSDVSKWCKENNIKLRIDNDIVAESDCCTQNLLHRPDYQALKVQFKNSLTQQAKAIDIEQIKNGYKTTDRPCGVGLNGVAINSNGDVVPCPGWNCVCGNVKHNTMLDILLHSSAFKKIRDIRYSDFKKCNGCDIRPFCHICFSKNANENNGDYMKITDHHCEVTRLEYEIVQEYCKGCE